MPLRSISYIIYRSKAEREYSRKRDKRISENIKTYARFMKLLLDIRKNSIIKIVRVCIYMCNIHIW